MQKGDIAQLTYMPVCDSCELGCNTHHSSVSDQYQLVKLYIASLYQDSSNWRLVSHICTDVFKISLKGIA